MLPNRSHTTEFFCLCLQGVFQECVFDILAVAHFLITSKLYQFQDHHLLNLQAIHMCWCTASLCVLPVTFVFLILFETSPLAEYLERDSQISFCVCVCVCVCFFFFKLSFSMFQIRINYHYANFYEKLHFI